MIVLLCGIKLGSDRIPVEAADDNAFMDVRLLCIVQAKARQVDIADMQPEGGSEDKA